MRRARTLLSVLAVSSVLSVPLYGQCPDGSPPPCGARTAPQSASVAVLAFENISRDTADLYLIDGLNEELTNRLNDIARLRVSPRGAVRRAQRSAEGDPLAIARSLSVRYVVEGSIRRAGQRVRVSARLLRGADGTRMWGQDYDRTMDDLLALQEDIASEVAGNVAGQLLPAEQRVLARRLTTSAGAYDHYLRGKYLIPRRTDAAIRQAVAEFDAALRLDPGFARAWARRAQALVTAFGYGVAIASRDTMTQWAIQSAARAVALDSTASDSWIAMGLVQGWFPPQDVDRSRASLLRATQLDPRDADALHTLGVTLQTIPDLPAAAAAFHRALALEPGRGVSLLDLAQIEYSARRYETALRFADSAIAAEPQQSRSHQLRALLRARAGDAAGARASAATAERQSTGTIRTLALATRIVIECALGDSAAARRLLPELRTATTLPTAEAMALIALGDRDAALAVLEAGPIMPVDRLWLQFPEFDAVRRDPRFTAAVNRWAPRGARPL